jgi:hypothetical protein
MKSLINAVAHFEVGMCCIRFKETQKTFPKILKDWRLETITSVSKIRDSTDTAMKAYLYNNCCAAGKLLQITAGADRRPLNTTPTPLPHPFNTGTRLQLSPGAMRGRATPWQSLPHSFLRPPPPRPHCHPQTPPAARGSCRSPARHPGATEISSLGNFRWIDSANFGNHRPWLDYPIWHTVVRVSQLLSPWPTVCMRPMTLSPCRQHFLEESDKQICCVVTERCCLYSSWPYNRLLRLEVLKAVLIISVSGIWRRADWIVDTNCWRNFLSPSLL